MNNYQSTNIVEGAITDVTIGSPSEKLDTVILHITDENLEKYEAMFPRLARPDSDMMELKKKLKGSKVRYEIKLGWTRENRLPDFTYVLEVFSGPLRKKLYEANLQ